MSEKWFVRGVSDDLARMVSSVAKSRGVAVGRIVEDALRAHLQGMDCSTTLSGSPKKMDELSAISERLGKIERLLAKLCGPEAVSTSGSRLPPDTVERIIALAESGMRAPDIVSAVKASRASVYRILAERRSTSEPGIQPSVRTARQCA